MSHPMDRAALNVPDVEIRGERSIASRRDSRHEDASIAQKARRLVRSAGARLQAREHAFGLRIDRSRGNVGRIAREKNRIAPRAPGVRLDGRAPDDDS